MAGAPRLVIGDARPVGAFVFDLLAAPRDGLTRGMCPEPIVIGDPRPVGAFVFDLLAAPRDGSTPGMCHEASYW